MKVRGMLFERTAISRKPEELARQKLEALREEDRMTTDLCSMDTTLIGLLVLATLNLKNPETIMQITLNLPDDLVAQLSPLEDKLPQILELGLRELNAGTQVGFTGAAEVLEFLATLPSPEEIVALRPSETLKAQINYLLEKNRIQGLTADEEQS